jgi:hypothetical protein
MKRFVKYLKALRLYFVMRETKYWHRNSTNEWVLEVNTQIVGEYNCTSRHPHKFKFMTNLVWLRYFWGTVNDLRNYV